MPPRDNAVRTCVSSERTAAVNVPNVAKRPAISFPLLSVYFLLLIEI
jgi:hypothetical protein